MKKIAFDVMGNDNGVRAGVEAALDFVSKNLDYIVVLIGDREEISTLTVETERIQIIDIKDVVDPKLGARAARGGKTTMSVAIDMVKDGKADVVMSSGDSGIYLSMATLQLKRLSGVKRPAFMPVFPTIVKGKRFVMLDVGANLVSTPEMLEQWAQLGSIFVENVLGIKKPRVGIVNIGTEDKKGNEFQVEANFNLKKRNDLNYIGFVEPRELLNSEVDVAVIDGYGGNLVLKTMEGTVLSLLSVIKSELTSKTKYKIGAFISKGAFVNVKESLDYRNVGAAWIIGLNGLAIKTHGSSDKKAYIGAFSQIAEALNNNALEKFKKGRDEKN